MKNLLTPRISVVMSAYNAERYISEAIDSVLAQTFRDFELIIIDDASTDNTVQEIKKYSDKRVIFIMNSRNVGVSSVRNVGLRSARGKYIAILDADDISLPTRFEIQYRFLEENPNIYLVGTGAVNMNENGNETTVFNPLITPEKLAVALRKQNCFCHSTIMFRREPQILYREKMKYCEDYDLFLQALSLGQRLQNIPDRLLKYRVYASSISMSKRGYQFLSAMKTREFYAERIKKGKDSYEAYDPDKYFEEGKDSKEYLMAEIEAEFKANNFKQTRRYCLLYNKQYGFEIKPTIYFLSTALGISLVNTIRKILWGRTR